MAVIHGRYVVVMMMVLLLLFWLLLLLLQLLNMLILQYRTVHVGVHIGSAKSRVLLTIDEKIRGQVLGGPFVLQAGDVIHRLGRVAYHVSLIHGEIRGHGHSIRGHCHTELSIYTYIFPAKPVLFEILHGNGYANGGTRGKLQRGNRSESRDICRTRREYFHDTTVTRRASTAAASEPRKRSTRTAQLGLSSRDRRGNQSAAGIALAYTGEERNTPLRRRL